MLCLLKPPRSKESPRISIGGNNRGGDRESTAVRSNAGWQQRTIMPCSNLIDMLRSGSCAILRGQMGHNGAKQGKSTKYASTAFPSSLVSAHICPQCFTMRKCCDTETTERVRIRKDKTRFLTLDNSMLMLCRPRASPNGVGVFTSEVWLCENCQLCRYRKLSGADSEVWADVDACRAGRCCLLREGVLFHSPEVDATIRIVDRRFASSRQDTILCRVALRYNGHGAKDIVYAIL